MKNHESRALFITNDETTAAELARLAAAAGAHSWRSHDAESARRHWTAASVVVIAADAVEECVRKRLMHRDNVVLLTEATLTSERAWSLAAAIGADQVASLPAASTWLTKRLAPRQPVATQGQAIVVSGARGGVGASILAGALSLRSARHGNSTLLIDGDSRGGGLDLALGWENVAGLRWNDLAGSCGPFDPQRLKTSLPTRNGLGLLSFDRQHAQHHEPELAAAVVTAARLAFDQVILDLPRYCDDWIDRVTHAGDTAVLVIPSEVRAVTAARPIITRYARHCENIELVLRGPSPGRLRARDIQKATGLPLAAQIHTDSRLASAAETGAMTSRSRRGNLAAVCDTLLRRFAATTRHVAADTDGKVHA